MTDATARGPTALWFHRPAPRPGARLRLVCVPYAGAGAGVFTPWAARLPHDVELVAVRLPGRESRIRERPYARWGPLAAAFREALAEEIASPYVLFGHSMGGMLVYETVTRPLGRAPERVVISGCRAPGTTGEPPLIHDLPDARFVEHVARLSATPPPVLANSALMRVLMPTLRADFRLAETWPQGPARPVPVPVTTLWGVDDEVAPRAAVTAWRSLAPHGFRSHGVAGGHFFPHDSADDVCSLLCGEIARRADEKEESQWCDPRTSPPTTRRSANVPVSSWRPR
ncbi:thioesterase II family protein [Streptomyces sp. NRRL B-1140]|uniref:thioesterase II family protein n=1 Tax=Streptomyces sp. NRRL B-1140 TaxID=1415549 RepID=UPI00099D8791|nr:alpha/beta fold hydrolase [Streptomyces sp. NRRL B-1140]